MCCFLYKGFFLLRSCSTALLLRVGGYRCLIMNYDLVFIVVVGGINRKWHDADNAVDERITAALSQSPLDCSGQRLVLFGENSNLTHTLTSLLMGGFRRTLFYAHFESATLYVLYIGGYLCTNSIHSMALTAATPNDVRRSSSSSSFGGKVT